MKTFIAAVALTIAFPAAAQQTGQQQHAQHQGMNHAQHQGMNHAQHQGMDHGKEHKGCCDHKGNDGKPMKCCEAAMKSGKKMACCEKAGQGQHQGMKH